MKDYEIDTHWAGDGGCLHNFSLLLTICVSPPWSGQHKQLNTLSILCKFNIANHFTLEKYSNSASTFCFAWKYLWRRLYILQSLTFNSSPSSRVSTLSSEEVAVLVHSYHGHMMRQLRSTVTHWFELRSLDLLNNKMSSDSAGKNSGNNNLNFGNIDCTMGS